MSQVKTPETPKICPFMSGHAITMNVPGILDHKDAQAVTAMMVPCAREKCELWKKDLCSLGPETFTAVLGNVAVGLCDVADGLKPFDAPLTGSPMTHLVKAIENLIDILRDRKAIPKTPN